METKKTKQDLFTPEAETLLQSAPNPKASFSKTFDESMDLEENEGRYSSGEVFNQIQEDANLAFTQQDSHQYQLNYVHQTDDTDRSSTIVKPQDFPKGEKQ